MGISLGIVSITLLLGIGIAYFVKVAENESIFK